jgi:uncharacterized protein (DUF4213/DUF364 family)
MSTANPWEVYDLLLDQVGSQAAVEEVIIGLTWTLCRAEGVGLAMSPGQATRTLSWPGTLRGRGLAEVAAWVREWNPWQATVGMAAINAAINVDPELASRATPVATQSAANLAVFEHFHTRLQGKRVAVVGRYPGLDTILQDVDLTVLERDPGPNDLPDPAAEYLLPEAEWVFLTSTSLTNKTFPRLAQLAANSNLVLMGPTTPWLAELADFGVDYLAGVHITDAQQLRDTVAEGGGTRIFETGVRYGIVDLGQGEMHWIKSAIADIVARREALKSEMETWYCRNANKRFPRQTELLTLDNELSSLDSRFKRLWDVRH